MKLPSRLHCGFTLIELMIVIAIIGILAPIAYPKLTVYIERGHDLQAKLDFTQLFHTISQNIIDNDGSIPSQIDQINNKWEYYFIDGKDMTGPIDDGYGWKRHDKLSQHIQSSGMQDVLNRLVSLKNPDFVMSSGRPYIYFTKTTYHEFSGVFGNWVGFDSNDDTSKLSYFYWYTSGETVTNFADASVSDGTYFAAYSWNGTNYPEGYYKFYQVYGTDAYLNKLCSPGKGRGYYHDTNGFKDVSCMWIVH